MRSTNVPNFTLVPHQDSCVNAYNNQCGGCQSTGSDIMITFGSTVSVLDGNNKIVNQEYPKHVDVFLTQKQAARLVEQLQKALLDNSFVERKI